jgi:two-component system phosphate regulon sensor histidine kinase PhoR
MAQMVSARPRAGRSSRWQAVESKLGASIGTKIILPYLLLALAVGGVGAFVVTSLVTNSLQERFNNQLLDAGRIVAETIVGYEQERLAVLRAVAGTEGVAESLATGDRGALAALVPQILLNSGGDAVELLDRQGIEIYGWQRPPGNRAEGAERFGADLSGFPEVQRVLQGFVDEFGSRRVMLAETDQGLMIYTIGPVLLDTPGGDQEQVGAAMIGSYVDEMTAGLTETALARVTLYDRSGNVLATSLGGGQAGMVETLEEAPVRYQTVIDLLQESSARYAVVTRTEDEVPLREVEFLGQQYVLAYGDWRLRGQSFGLFSVALPSNFIVSAASVSRKTLSLLFSLATVAVFALGFSIAQRLIRPLRRLVETSKAVARGDLKQRTGIQSPDEIGSLARSFDAMTEQLAAHHQQLVEQANELKAILNGIADGVIVVDPHGRMISSNPAAQQILGEVSPTSLMDQLSQSDVPLFDRSHIELQEARHEGWSLASPRRYQIGSRMLSASAAPVTAPGGEEVRTVLVLRDVTREVEAEQLKDGFIITISHELRTPLTAVKGYSDLLVQNANGSLDEHHMRSLKIINDNANQLMRHINKLLDISMIQSGSLGLQQKRLCFNQLVETIVENWREAMENKNLALRSRFSGGDQWVYGDQARLSWAIDNLLSNACNYTLDGGQVMVRVSSQDGQARLDVSDTGVGIAAADQQYLFSRFFRANNEQIYDVRGVGLGLFITRSIVEGHGGRVWAESELGVGSTFSLILPLAEDESAGARVSNTAQ